MRGKRLVLIGAVGLLATIAVLAATGYFASGQPAGSNASSKTALSRQATPSGQPAFSGLATQGAPAAPVATDSSGGALPPGSTTSGGADTSLPSLLDRQIILNGSLVLNVSDVSAAFDEASRLARANGGYVEKSSFSASAQASNQKSATLTLRVPSDQYDQLLAQLRGISGAKVQTEGSQSTEVTEQYTDLQSRLRNLESTEQSYLTLLNQAKSVQDILTVSDRLDNVRGQIEQIQGRINVLDNAINLATIDLTLAPVVPGKAAPTGGPKTVSQAFADAWAWSLEALRYAAASGAVAVVALAWLAVPAALVILGVRRMRRRPSPASPAPLTTGWSRGPGHPSCWPQGLSVFRPPPLPASYRIPSSATYKGPGVRAYPPNGGNCTDGGGNCASHSPFPPHPISFNTQPSLVLKWTPPSSYE
jgi:hypothetical protein